MNIIQSILKFAENNNGTITAADARKMGILHGNLGYLVKKGKLEKSSRGVYILPDVWDNEIYNLQNRFKKEIYSLYQKRLKDI